MNEELDAAATLRHDLVRIIRECLGLPDDVAAPMAERLVAGLCRSRVLQEVAGLAEEERRATLYAAIDRDFNGRNVRELMLRYNVSRSTVYRAAKKQSHGDTKLSQTGAK